LRATYRRTHGIGYLFGSYDLDDDLLYGSYRRSRSGADFLDFLAELRERYDRDERLHIVCDNLSTHTTPAGSDHPDHDTIEQELLRYIEWRNQHRHDTKLRKAEKRGCFH
jgi:transposase